MAASERTACRVTVPVSVASSTVSVTLGAQANPGDVIVVAVAASGVAVNATGLAGTWTQVPKAVGTPPSSTLLIGTGITVAGDTFSVTGFSSNTGAIVATAFTGLTDSASVLASSVTTGPTTATSVTTPAITANSGRILVGVAAHAAATSGTANINNPPTWSNSGVNTRVGSVAGATRVVAFDYTDSTAASVTSQWTSPNSTSWSAIVAELIPAPLGANGSLTLAGSAGAAAHDGAAGSLALAGSGTSGFATGAAGALSLSGGGPAAAAPAAAGSLTLLGANDPLHPPTPIYLAAFTVDVDSDFGGTPLVAVTAPTSDYVSDDTSDLLSYPTPAYDQWGRPLAS